MVDLPLAEYGLEWFKDVLDQINTWFRDQLIEGYRTLSVDLFNTPLPEGSGVDLVFSPPAADDAPWADIYQTLVGGEVMMLALVLLFVAVQGRHFLRIFRLGSAYRDRQTRRSAWTGGVLIVAWYWVAVLSLWFVHGVSAAMVPDVTAIGASLISLLPIAAANPLMTFLLTSVGAIAILLLKSIYFLRVLLLYVYLYGMPIGIALAYSNLPVVSRVASRFCRQFIPLLLLPLPAAILFRGYAFLFVGEPVVSPATVLFQYVAVSSLPVVALYLTWKTFRYAAPFVTHAISRTGQVAVTAGVVTGLGATVGAGAAATTARFGPRAGLVQAAIQRSPIGSQHSTSNDTVTSDAPGSEPPPPYRRTEHDPPRNSNQ